MAAWSTWAKRTRDGATLAMCLSEIAQRNVPEALGRYEDLRLTRASRVQGLAEANKTRFHLPDLWA